MKVDTHSVIRYPLSTEKAVRLMEAENVLMFAVDMRATKIDIRKSVEEMFSAHVIKVRTLINRKGIKVAFVKFSPETPAIDIATNLGMV